MILQRNSAARNAQRTIWAKSSASSAYRLACAVTCRTSRGAAIGFFTGPSIFGGVPRTTLYTAFSSGFHGTGTSMYPSDPHTYAVLSACTLIGFRNA